MPDVNLAIRRAAEKYGVRPDILARLIKQESGGNNNAKSPAGARGIAQFMPGTAREYGVNLNDNRITDDLEGAAHYLHDNLKRTGGSYAKALSIYNSGRPDGYKSIPETKNYVKSILGGRTPNIPSAQSATVVRGGTPAVKAEAPDNTALIAQYLATQHQPDSLVALASGLLAGSEVPSEDGSKTTGSKPSHSPSAKDVLGRIAHAAQSMGLKVGENPRFGGVSPVHVDGSYHYKGRAVDISGDPAKLAEFAKHVDSVYGGKLTELFWQGPGGVDRKNGQRIPQGSVSGHRDHVHVAI